MSAYPALRPERPPRRRLAQLAALVPEAAPDAAAHTDVQITGITHDSRGVRPGDLYAALPGERTHGARFAGDAVRAGAVAVLTDPAGRPAAEATGVPAVIVAAPRGVLGAVAAWVYGDPSADLSVLGVTGTNGKTTTAYLLEAGLRAAGHTTGLVGTIDTRVAGERVPSVRTTPECTDLQALFAVMRERGVDSVAMEVSSHALALHRVDGTRFAAGLFTNLSQDHLDFHGDLETYFAAKAALFDGRCAHEIVNIDDPYGRRLVRPATVTVSAEGAPEAAWRATGIEHRSGGPAFEVYGPHGAHAAAAVRSPGAFSVANALLAIAALVTVGVPLTDAVRGTAALDVPGRMEQVDRGQGFLAFVDYAHTPEAIAGVLAALRPLAKGRLIVVLGGGGDRDRSKRPLMGAAAARSAEVVIVTDDNPRSEDPADIRAAIAGGARQAGSAEVLDIAGRREAIGTAVRLAAAGDTVLVAGKGHEQGQEVGGVVHPFDDRSVLVELIDGAGAP
ncbi:MAG: UDP-N-acetylmuramoyl-L-alanyl-D-glutamate--2,6-diaminopimelate ligase [Actinomycetota bacterium]|nr:UDP-N-acetylmuramoyl-L-alanyl-D-glutamate--2,6-diaminopimelate ligase [Actinomycetota bacterium]